MQLEEVRFILPNPDSIFQSLRQHWLRLWELILIGELVRSEVVFDSIAIKGEVAGRTGTPA
jgi:hypothetical protein